MTLPDGTQQKVLVPQVYLMPRAGDLRTDGTLITGRTVHIAATGDITNSGTVAGRDLLDLSAANLTNLGRLSANTVSLNASNDLANIGGRIEAVDRLSLSAGRDLTVATTTASGDGAAGFGQFSRTQVDRVAGRDLTLNAAEVLNAASGPTTAVDHRQTPKTTPHHFAGQSPHCLSAGTPCRCGLPLPSPSRLPSGCSTG